MFHATKAALHSTTVDSAPADSKWGDGVTVGQLKTIKHRVSKIKQYMSPETRTEDDWVQYLVLKRYMMTLFEASEWFFEEKNRNRRGSDLLSADDEEDARLAQVVKKEEPSVPAYKEKQELRVKFVLNGVDESSAQTFFASFLGTERVPYNAAHASLYFGRKCVDWTTASLSFPRSSRITKPFVLLDVGYITVYKDEEGEVFSPDLEKVCKVMRKWNLTKTYSKFEANCAHFVNEVMQELGFSLEDAETNDRAIAILLKRVQDGKFTKSITSEMLKLDGEVDEVEFKTHAQLDSFIRKQYEEYGGKEKFIAKYPMVHRVLKAYDRAFWEQHYRDVDNPECEPYLCPLPPGEDLKSSMPTVKKNKDSIHVSGDSQVTSQAHLPVTKKRKETCITM